MSYPTGRNGPPMPQRLARPGIAPVLPVPQDLPPAVVAAKIRPLRRPLPRDPLALAPDTGLALSFGLDRCIALGVLPWMRRGGEVMVLAQGPARLAAARDALTAAFGPFLRPIETGRADFDRALLAHFGPALAARAESRVAPAESCRKLDARLLRKAALVLAALAALALLLVPLASLTLVFMAALLALVVNTGFKFAAALATLRASAGVAPAALAEADLPAISVLIALYREADIAPRLIRRLERLDYPRDRLQVILVVEDDDGATRAALAQAALPPWMQVVAAPAGRIRTKPRALNIALDLARGDIVGVYDAEDAPAPDQLQKVAAAFAAAPPETACLQAALDYYNPRHNWLSRCFTLEYALWFRLVLPGIERLGLPMPLGGTSLFLRREVLVGLGGWDAHNVTEDADLGIRLARHGYGTRMICSTTQEEANCRALPWVRQRSRWIKGYLLTWLSHMRHPRQLWRQLGPRGFAGFQLVFFGALSQALLVPALASFWVIPLGYDHVLNRVLPPAGMETLFLLCILAEALNFMLHLVALRRSGHRLSALWIITLHAYFALGCLAAAKALAETLAAPFYWDKTRHGQFDTAP